MKDYSYVLSENPENELLVEAVRLCNKEQAIEAVANVRFAVARRDWLSPEEKKVAKMFGLTPREFKNGGKA